MMDIETGNNKKKKNSGREECNLFDGCTIARGSSEERTSADANDTSTVHCPICFEAASSTNLLIRSEKCGHAWCQECLLDYCEFQISNHRIPIPCPSSASTTTTSRHDDKGCHHHLQADFVRQILLDTQTHPFIAKFDRLEQLSQDPSLVACPRCDAIVDKPSNHDNDNDTNARTCPKCNHQFCSVHLDAHLGKSCQDHVAHATTLSLPNTKPCSHCGAALHKYAGCDHVVCPACHNDMCFRCGTHQHLTGKVTRYCSHCQQGYLDHRYLWQIRLYYCFTLPFVLPFVAAYAAVMMGGVVLTFCCCGCFGCGAWMYEGKRKADPPLAFLYVTFIVFLPLLLMLYDVGYRFDVVDDFLEWSLVERPASYQNENVRNGQESSSSSLDVVPSTPTSSNISED